MVKRRCGESTGSKEYFMPMPMRRVIMEFIMLSIIKDYSTLGVHYRDLQARVHEQETRNLT